MRVASTLLALAVLMMPAGRAAALTTSHLASDADLTAILPQAAINFVAEGRIGDRSGAATFELDLGQDTGAPAVTAQYGWVSAQVEPFSVVYDNNTGTVTFSLGGRNLVFAPAGTFTDIFVRTRAVNLDSDVRVDNLFLDGAPVNNQSAAAGDGVDILRIQGGMLNDGFTLTGNAILTWTGSAPTQSRLAFQVKVGTPGPPTPVDDVTFGRIKALYR